MNWFYNEEYHIKQAEEWQRKKDNPIVKMLHKKYNYIENLRWLTFSWIILIVCSYAISTYWPLLILMILLSILVYWIGYENEKIYKAMERF